MDMADLRRCIGSAKFGIEAHDAPPEDFPVQPSQKDGLGRMCKAHWTEYTRALRKAALPRDARTLAEVETPEGQAALEAAAKEAQLARQTAKAPRPTVVAGKRRRKAGEPEPIRTRPARSSKNAAVRLLPSANSQGDAG
jgi:hypothetical protein